MQGIFAGSMKQNYVGHIMAEIYKEKVYEPFLKHGMTILEVGGNVGIVTLYLSEYARKLFVMEPLKAHLKCLRKTVKFNKLEDVVIIPKALDAKDGTRNFYFSDYNSTCCTLKVQWQEGYTEKVQCASMSTILEECKVDTIDFMKLDVEGSEIDILSSDSFAKEAPRIKSMLVEYHTWCGYQAEALECHLSRLGYKWNKVASDASLYYAVRQ